MVAFRVHLTNHTGPMTATSKATRSAKPRILVGIFLCKFV